MVEVAGRPLRIDPAEDSCSFGRAARTRIEPGRRSRGSRSHGARTSPSPPAVSGRHDRATRTVMRSDERTNTQGVYRFFASPRVTTSVRQYLRFYYNKFNLFPDPQIWRRPYHYKLFSHDLQSSSTISVFFFSRLFQKQIFQFFHPCETGMHEWLWRYI